MDEQSMQSIRERLDRVEALLGRLQQQVLTIDGGLADLKRATVPPANSLALPPLPPPPPLPAKKQVYCPNCKGGNPPDAAYCMWCWSLMPLPEYKPQAQPQIQVTPMQPVRITEPLPRLEAVTGIEAKPLIPTPAILSPARIKHEARHVAAQEATLKHHIQQFRIRPTAPVVTALPTTAAPLPKEKPRMNFDVLGKSEFWLNKVGIGLLLLGLAFFFKYSIDRGWLNEQVRVALGLALGTVLLGFGLGMYSQRRHFSQVLLGGSIATYYITGYAAYQMLHIVSYELAFGFMAAVTALALILAIRQDEAILSLIGVTGGLLTPFVLEHEPAGVSGLIMYTCVVLAGASGVYMLKGWRSLLWLAYTGGILVFTAAYMATVYGGHDTASDRWALQGGALFGVIAFWAVPVLREFLAARNPEQWRPKSLMVRFADLEDLASKHVYVLILAVPLMTLAFSRAIWLSSVDNSTWGLWTVGGALVYGLVAWAIRRDLPIMAYVHAMMGILLLTLGVAQFFNGDALVIALAVEATALLFVSRRLKDRGTEAWGDIIWLISAMWLTQRLVYQIADFSWMNFTPTPLTDLIVIALLAVSAFVSIWVEKVIYHNAVHVALLAWLFAQLYPLSDGTSLVMLAWLGYGVILNIRTRLWPALFTQANSGYASHATFAAAAVMFCVHYFTGHEGALAVFNMKTLADAAFVASAAVMSFAVMPQRYAPAYRVTAHAAVLLLLQRELMGLDTQAGYVLLSWALYLALVQYLARRSSDTVTADLAHIPFLMALGWLAVRLLYGPDESPIVFNLASGINLAVIAIAAGTSRFIAPHKIGAGRLEAWRFYLLAAYLGLLGWVWQELHTLQNGSGYVILAWAYLALAVIYLSKHINDTLLSRGAVWLGDATFVVTGIWLAQRLLNVAEATPVLNMAALTDLLVMALAVGAWFLTRERRWAIAYPVVVHVALLAWFSRELSALQDGNAYISIAWGVYAIILLVGGLSGRRVLPLVYAGLATLFLVIAKLFLIDLAALDPLWRVLLFLGFGGALLVLSYYFQNVIGGKPGTGGRRRPGGFHWPTRLAH